MADRLKSTPEMRLSPALPDNGRHERTYDWISASASKQEQLNELMGQIMGCYSVSDDEGPLTDAVEVFLKNSRI